MPPVQIALDLEALRPALKAMALSARVYDGCEVPRARPGKRSGHAAGADGLRQGRAVTRRSWCLVQAETVTGEIPASAEGVGIGEPPAMSARASSLAWPVRGFVRAAI
jgi:hypothetical protein